MAKTFQPRSHRRLRRDLGSGWPSRQGGCRRGEVNATRLPLWAGAPSGARRVIESYSFTARFDDQAPEVLRLARWLAAGCQEAQLQVCPCPVPAAGEIALAAFVELHPAERHP